MKKWFPLLLTVLLVGALSWVGLVVDRFTLLPETAPFLSRVQAWVGTRQATFEGDPGSVTLVGHRGSGESAGEFNENTEASIQRAIDSGIRTIEIDLLILPAEGRVILFHDQTTDRLLKDPIPDRDGLPDWETLRGLKWRANPEGAIQEGENQVLGFDDFLGWDLFDDPEIHWVFDLKSQGMREKLDAIEQFPGERVIVMGTEEMIAEFEGSDYRMGYVAAWGEGNNDRDFLWGSDFLVRRCDSLGERMNLELLVLPATFLEPEFLDLIRGKVEAIKIWTYLAESETSWDRCLGLGADGLIIDNVEEAVRAYPQIKRPAPP